jgi:hypothetical protein
MLHEERPEELCAVAHGIDGVRVIEDALIDGHVPHMRQRAEPAHTGQHFGRRGALA